MKEKNVQNYFKFPKMAKNCVSQKNTQNCPIIAQNNSVKYPK